jgi:large subunit ribosomal protein L21
MYSIVATGVKQLKVAAGDVVTVEKLVAAAGETVTFDVIFLADEDKIVTDAAELASATVTGEVLEHSGRGDRLQVQEAQGIRARAIGRT